MVNFTFQTTPNITAFLAALANRLHVSSSALVVVAQSTDNVVLRLPNQTVAQESIALANGNQLSSVGVTGAAAVSSPSPPPPSSGDDGGVSGATIGIIVGCVLGVILLAAVVFFGRKLIQQRSNSFGSKDQEKLDQYISFASATWLTEEGDAVELNELH